MRARARTSEVAACVQVLRIRDGHIVATRDDHDHLRLAAATGHAEDLGAAVTAEATAG